MATLVFESEMSYPTRRKNPKTGQEGKERAPVKTKKLSVSVLTKSQGQFRE